MKIGRLGGFDRSRPMSEINVTPMVDVMLVLVVIFILTAPLLASSIRLDLPRSPSVSPAEGRAFVALSLNREGQAFLADQPVDLVQLGERLAQLAKSNPDTEVQLRADASVPYGKVVEIMGLAQKAGLVRIGFVAQAQ